MSKTNNRNAGALGDIINFYEVIDDDYKREPKQDPTYKEHFINPNSHVALIGPTGSGKSNALLNFLRKKNGRFYKIIIFNPATTDEPLYNYLQDAIDGIEFYNDINELPSLSDFDDEDKDKEKLIVFDDFTDLKKKEMSKLQEYLKAGRKFGFNCWVLAQNYTSIPKPITRNCHYFIVYRQNDNATLNNIIKNHNIDNLDKNLIIDAYQYATNEPMNFFMIDTTVGAGIKRIRKNFKEFLRV
jgi:energy-coupling factor transporter ATP-binding protein EcfA2